MKWVALALLSQTGFISNVPMKWQLLWLCGFDTICSSSDVHSVLFCFPFRNSTLSKLGLCVCVCERVCYFKCRLGHYCRRRSINGLRQWMIVELYTTLVYRLSPVVQRKTREWPNSKWNRSGFSSAVCLRYCQRIQHASHEVVLWAHGANRSLFTLSFVYRPNSSWLVAVVPLLSIECVSQVCSLCPVLCLVFGVVAVVVIVIEPP